MSAVLKRALAIAAISLTLFACKGNNAGAKTAGTPAADAGKTDESRLTVDNGVLPGAERRVRVGGVALRGSALFLPFVGFARKGPYAATLARAEKVCGFSPLHAIEDAAWSQGVDGWLLVLKPALGEDEALECLGKLADAPVSKRGGRGYVQSALFTATARDGVVVVGNDSAVEVFLAAPANSDERRAPVLAEGELFRGSGTAPGDAKTRFEGAILLGKGRATTDGKGAEKLEVRISAEFDDPKTAEGIAERFEGMRDQAKVGAKNPRSVAVLDSFRFAHPGRRFLVEFGTQGDRKSVVEYVDFLVGLYELFSAEEAKAP